MMVKINFPSSVSDIDADSGVSLLIFSSAGLMNVRFISAKLSRWDCGN